MPGSVDTHGHVALFGRDERKVSLTGATTKQEILAPADKRGDPPARRVGRRDADGNPLYIQAPTNRVPNFAAHGSIASFRIQPDWW